MEKGKNYKFLFNISRAISADVQKKKSVLQKISAKERTRSWKCCFAVNIVFFLIGLVAVGVIFFGSAVDDVLDQVLSLKEGGFLYSLWKIPKVPTMVLVYPFNYTNVDAVLYGEELPHVQELGPYVFREMSEKMFVTFNDNGTLSYQSKRVHEFLPELSKGSLDDVIFAPSLATLTAFLKKDKSLVEQSGLMFLSRMTSAKPFLRIKVQDFIWGYGDMLTGILLTIKGDVKKFGVLTNRKGHNPDWITVGSGSGDTDIGVITRYSGKDRIEAYKDPQCDSIAGTDGSFFPRRKLGVNTSIHVYVKDACRLIPMDYVEEVVTSTYDVPAYRYQLPEDVFDPRKPENHCFCSDSSCPPIGTFSLGPCYFGAPVVLSFPHFTHGDPELRKKVTGLVPDEGKYTTTLDIHKLGLPLAGGSKLQIGLLVNDSSNVPYLRGKLEPGTVLPISWLNIKMGPIPQPVQDIVYHVTYTLNTIINVIKYLSVLILIISVILLYYLIKR